MNPSDLNINLIISNLGLGGLVIWLSFDFMKNVIIKLVVSDLKKIKEDTDYIKVKIGGSKNGN